MKVLGILAIMSTTPGAVYESVLSYDDFQVGFLQRSWVRLPHKLEFFQASTAEVVSDFVISSSTVDFLDQ